MARPLRIELAGGLYHVTSRGDRREAIYRDDEDLDVLAGGFKGKGVSAAWQGRVI